jgi:SanA protein
MLKVVARSIFYLVLVSFALLSLANLWVIQSTDSRIYNEISEVPNCEVALVLGTSRRLTTGADNPFFYNRMQTAAELYEHGKVKSFLLSGDSTSRYYNEPKDMRKALIELGVPDEAILLDYAGLSTLESMKRCRDVFKIESVTVVTQRFHSYRAVFIADHFDLNANAMITTDVPIDRSFRTLVREIFARTKAVADIYLS